MRLKPPWRGLVPLKETPESSLTSPTTWGHSEKMAICDPGSGSHRRWICLCLHLGLLGLQNCEPYLSVAYQPPSLWYSITAAWMHWDREVGMLFEMVFKWSLWLSPQYSFYFISLPTFHSGIHTFLGKPCTLAALLCVCYPDIILIHSLLFSQASWFG